MRSMRDLPVGLLPTDETLHGRPQREYQQRRRDHLRLLKPPKLASEPRPQSPIAPTRQRQQRIKQVDDVQPRPWYLVPLPPENCNVPLYVIDSVCRILKSAPKYLSPEQREDLAQEVATVLLEAPTITPEAVALLIRKQMSAVDAYERSVETIGRNPDDEDAVPFIETWADDFNLEEHVFERALYGHIGNDLGEMR